MSIIDAEKDYGIMNQKNNILGVFKSSSRKDKLTVACYHPYVVEVKD